MGNANTTEYGRGKKIPTPKQTKRTNPINRGWKEKDLQQSPLSSPRGGVGSRLPEGAEIKSTFTMLKTKKHPSVCAAEQQGGFQKSSLLGKNYCGHLSRDSPPLRAPRKPPRSGECAGPAGHLRGAGRQVLL